MAELGRWVFTLGGGVTDRCIATAITAHAALTAAHCIDGGTMPRSGDRPIRFVDRACAHGDCARRVVEGELASIEDDLGVLWTADKLPALPDDEPPRMAEVLGIVDSAVVVTSAGEVWAVCRPEFRPRWGEAEGSIQDGDSGSPVIGLTAEGPVVLGVASHRREIGDGWYFAPVRSLDVWPDSALEAPPRRVMLASADLLPVEDCQ